ncbi:LEA_2 domain-containing protein [Psidium guajava]|nr:LEA_2 domain-containing protein [Psidium guajava]
MAGTRPDCGCGCCLLKPSLKLLPRSSSPSGIATLGLLAHLPPSQPGQGPVTDAELARSTSPPTTPSLTTTSSSISPSGTLTRRSACTTTASRRGPLRVPEVRHRRGGSFLSGPQDYEHVSPGFTGQRVVVLGGDGALRFRRR